MEQNLPQTSARAQLPKGLVTAITVACAIYLMFPVDLLPDVIPVVGNVDDLIAFLIAIGAAKKVERT